MERLLSAHQAAERLGVSIWTVARLARNGRLPSVQIGRRRLFAEEDLEPAADPRTLDRAHHGTLWADQ